MKIVKLDKRQDVASAIQTIRELKDSEIVFELEKGSPLLSSSSNLRLLKKTGEMLKKQVRVRTDDQIGRIMALKAEILDGSASDAKPNPVPTKIPAKVKRSDVKPRFSDILISKRGNTPIVMPKIQKAPTPATPLTSKGPVPKMVLKPTAYIRSAQNEFNPKATVSPKTSTIKKVGRSNFSKIFIVTMVVLVLVVFGLAVLLPTATITVYARSEPITRDVEVNVDKNATQINSTSMTVPGTLISREVTQTKNFPTTGTKVTGTKATGSVVIYNFTKEPLTLRASTTTLIANGKKFSFTQDATLIRPTAQIGTGSDQSVDPSSLTAPIPITAQDVGSDSNLPANTKFTIQNAALGNQSVNVYAINSAALAGGTSQTVQVLSQDDLNNAVTTLGATVAAQAQADLNSENNTSDTDVLSSGITQQVLAKTANKNVGDPATNFDMTMIAQVSGLSFKNDDVKQLIIQQINSVLSSDKYLLPDAKDTLTANFKNTNLPNGKGVLSVHYETVAAYKVDDSSMNKLLAGKSADEIKEILLAKPEIDRVDVEFSPFFVNKAPKLNGKIYIHTMLSQSS